jgi:dienelactone hydrolase
VRVILGAAVAAALIAPVAAEPYRLAPWKDELFAYPKVLSSENGGAYVRVEYIKERDLYGRDEIPERRAKPQYVSPTFQRTRTYDTPHGVQKLVGVGAIDGGARAVVIYIHGQGGTRFQGADDWTFGGNFNRIMNLMARNGGAYFSPDFTDLGEAGRDDIKALVLDQARRSPGAAIVVACGSQGGTVCWRLLRDPGVTPFLGGVLLLGSSHDDAFIQSPAVKGTALRIPIYVGHGTEDTVFDWREEEAFYRRVKKAAPDYPIRVALFDTGSHGTPIRMTDWRLVLNWMFEANGM